MAKATWGNDFDLLKLREKKMSIYIKLTPHNIAKFSVMVNLLFSQIINLNVEQGLPENNPKLKYQCLLMLDEFTSLGYMGIIETAIAYIAGYNLRLCLILQNRAQLDKNYKQSKDTLMNNCAVKIIYTPSENDSAKYYSEMLGYETVKGKSKSKSRGKTGSTSQSESDQKRALMMPQELLQMPFEEALVWLKGTKIIKIEKVMYFKDKSFNDRVRWPAPEIKSLFDAEPNPETEPEPEPEPPIDAIQQEIDSTLRLAAIEQAEREENEKKAALFAAFDGLEGRDSDAVKQNLQAAAQDDFVMNALQKLEQTQQKTNNTDDKETTS